jgi:hypothetical protein
MFMRVYEKRRSVTHVTVRDHVCASRVTAALAPRTRRSRRRHRADAAACGSVPFRTHCVGPRRNGAACRHVVFDKEGHMTRPDVRDDAIPATQPPVVEPLPLDHTDPAQQRAPGRGWNPAWGWALLALAVLVTATLGVMFGGGQDYS